MGSRRSIVAFCVLLVLTLVAYAPVFRAGFIWGDAERIGEGGAGVKDFRLIWCWPCAEQMRRDGGTGEGAAAAGLQGADGYAPAAESVLWLERRVFGGAAAGAMGYHLVSVLMHLVAAWMLWMLLRRLGLQWGALLGAALFAVHPVNVETVAWVAQQGAVLGMVFSLGAALAWLSWTGSQGFPRSWLSSPVERVMVYGVMIVSLALAVLSTPLAMVMPVGLLMIAWARQGRITRQVWLGWLPAAVMVAAYGVWLYVAAGSAVNGAEAGAVMAAMVRRVAAPVGLTWIHGEAETWLARAGWMAAMAGIGVAIGMRRKWTQGPLAAGLFFAAAVVVSVIFLGDAERVLRGFGDRMGYFAMVGIVGLLGAGAAGWVRGRPKAAGAVMVMALVVVATLTGLTMRRAWCFGDEVRLATDTLAKNPHAALAAERVADALIVGGEAGDREKAAGLYQQVMADAPGRTSAARSYAQLLAGEGKSRAAQGILEQVLKRNPDDAVANEALADMVVKGIGEAAYPRVLPFYEKAFEKAPGRAGAAGMLATVYESMGRWDDACRVLERTVPLNPRNSALRLRLAGLEGRAKKWDEANAQYDIGCALDPTNAEARAQWGQMLLAADRPREAETQFRRALDIDRTSAMYRVLLGKSLREQRKLGSALNEFRAAYELEDKLAVAYYEAAATCELMQDEDNVERYLQAALRADPQYTPARVAMARLFIKSNDPARRNIYRGITQLRDAVAATKEQDLSILVQYGLALSQAQEYEQALEVMDKAVALAKRVGLPGDQRELLLKSKGLIEVAAAKTGVVAGPPTVAEDPEAARISLMGTGMEFDKDKPLPVMPQGPAKEAVMRPLDLSKPPVEEQREGPLPAGAEGAGAAGAAATQAGNQGSMK